MLLKSKHLLFFTIFFAFSFKGKSQCPKSDAWVGGRLSGDFVKVVFQNQNHINADRFCSGIKRETRIDSFQVMIIRDTTLIFKCKNISQAFNADFKNFIKSVELNDKILFYSIWGTDYDGAKVYLNPLEYRIME
ncbi:hypothetical protein [Foetidibacter luteolus]|uniref:hypothetical protein n=1 Tax=Foetidibacter luteolus TaxID=2608880 RepID=UPI00129A6CD8|nr:hypothetical protein [Foetidibacter luteolus]